MPQRLLLALSVLAACNPSRDESDEALEHTLDLMLAERQAFLDDRDATQAQHARVGAQLAAFRPISTTELLALAGPDAKLVEDRPMGFFHTVSITADGARADALRFLATALARSRVVNASELVLAPPRWSVTLGVLVLPPTKTAKPSGAAAFAPSPDTAWCYASCRARRQRLIEKSARLAALEQTLGGLVTLHRDEQRLGDLLGVDQKFIGDELGPALAQLEGAAWLPAETRVTFGPGTLRLAAPAETAAACALSFPGCRVDGLGLLVELPRPR